MNKCIVVGEESEFGPIPVKGDLKSTLPYVAEQGYKYVELNLKYPFTLSAKNMKKILHENNLKVATLTTGYPYFNKDVSFTSKDENSRDKAIEYINEYIDLASTLGSQIVIGSIRGFGNSENAYEYFVEALQKILNTAKEKEVLIALEPINRYETKLINTVDEGMSMIKQLNHDNLRLLLDTFHMNIEEKSIIDSIKNAGSLISHFHVADNNRKPMWCGHLDFDDILCTLNNIGYKKAISAELIPLPDGALTIELISSFFKEKNRFFKDCCNL